MNNYNTINNKFKKKWTLIKKSFSLTIIIYDLEYEKKNNFPYSLKYLIEFKKNKINNLPK